MVVDYHQHLNLNRVFECPKPQTLIPFTSLVHQSIIQEYQLTIELLLAILMVELYLTLIALIFIYLILVELPVP